jgi:arabinogalactan oligomer/maltooligosaccharide transport system permease protein
MSQAPTPRAFAVGLGLAALVGTLLATGGSRELVGSAVRAGEGQLAAVTARAGAELVERTIAGGADPATTVAAWAREQDGLRMVRVVRDRDLVFSTAAADLATGATPRRLVRDEKPLFDLAQELRAAVDENREDIDQSGAVAAAAHKEEIAVEALTDGAVRVAAPFAVDGAVAGMVQVERMANAKVPAGGSAWPLALGLAALAALLGYAGATFLGGRRVLLLGLSAILVAGGLYLLVSRQRSAVAAGVAAREQALATQLVEQKARVEAALAGSGISGTGIDATSWDGDLFRRPRGIVQADGTFAANRLADATAALASRLTRIAGTAIVAGLAILACFGLGWASLLATTLHRYRVAYSYALPALIGMLVLVFFPFLYGLSLSFTNANIYNSDKGVVDNWVGLDNFGQILGDFEVSTTGGDGARVWNYHNFYWTLGFTLIWTVTNVAIGVTVGLALALALNTKDLRGKAIYRVLLILPWAIPNYITALIWKGMFHQQFGVINQILQIVHLSPVSWFESPLTSFATVLTTNGWLSFPFMMVISLGALQSIPGDLYEAARVDGASKWQQFTSITLPSLKPALVPAVILSVIWTFNMFNIIYLVSQGEPAGSTEILITQAYKLAFEQYRYGYAAAYSTVIFVILLAYGTWQNRVSKGTEAV